MAEDRGEWVAAAFAVDLTAGITEVVGFVGERPLGGEPVPRRAGRVGRLGRRSRTSTTWRGACSRGPCGSAGRQPRRPFGTGGRGPPGRALRAGPLPTLLPRSGGAAGRRGRPPGRGDPGCVAELGRRFRPGPRTGRGTPAARGGLAARPDPRRRRAFRFFFENRLKGRLELHRRMLIAISAFWRAAGKERLSRASAEMAAELADPQHAVPHHPFLEALAARSFRRAQERIKAGEDPRRGRVD